MVKNSIWLIGEPFNGLVLQARTALDPMAWMKCPFFLILLSTLWLLHDVQTQVCGLTMKAKSIFKERTRMRNCGFPTSRSHDITRYMFQRSNVRLVFVSLRYNRQVCLQLICMHKFTFWTTNLHEKPLWWLRPDVLNYSVNMHQISTNWVCLDFAQLVQPNNNNNEINGRWVDLCTNPLRIWLAWVLQS